METSRRQAMHQFACGFGALALTHLGAQGDARGASPVARDSTLPMARPRAKRIIFLFMQGGPSHVDTFDFKPDLVARDGQTIDFTGVRFGDFGQRTQQRLFRPLWKFRPYGQSQRWVSDLFPHTAQRIDDICLLHGLHTDGVAHGPCTLFLHTGATNLVRPSVGSWISYGLGTENDNLPAFVSIGPPASNGGPRNYGSAFLPAVHQATVLGRASQSAQNATIEHLVNPRMGPQQLRRQYDLLRNLNTAQRDGFDIDGKHDSLIRSYELAFRMQTAAPALFDMTDIDRATIELYGLDNKETEKFGRQCLLARRCAEAGVRYIQVNYSDESANPKWDQHAKMTHHTQHARATDRPTAALLTDLKQRGLLEDTLVWWGGEFGRTPFSQNGDGRDHNPTGFTMFLAGGGVKPGFAYGATDDIGLEAVDGRIHMHDMHATLLHLMGLDHRRLTYRFTGRDFRLTDVHGRVIDEILA